jgi:hypothetical protein
MGTILVTAPMLGIAEDWSSCNKHTWSWLCCDNHRSLMLPIRPQYNGDGYHNITKI